MLPLTILQGPAGSSCGAFFFAAYARFVLETAEAGETVYTDEPKAYKSLRDIYSIMPSNTVWESM